MCLFAVVATLIMYIQICYSQLCVIVTYSITLVSLNFAVVVVLDDRLFC